MRFFLLAGGVLCSACMAAQNTVGKGWKSYDYIRRSDPRLTAYNASGIRYLPVDKIATARVFADKCNGSFVNYHESDNSHTFGAATESFYRLSPRIVFYGCVSYKNFTGRNMGGSVFINPYDQPFDVVEYVDTTRGKKNLETYQLTGALSAEIARKLTFGAKVDYHTANYAKQKDLRHKNKLMDLSLTAGLTYRIRKNVEAGVNYFYRRAVEGVEFETYGTSDKQYYSLISYGAFFGTVEQFGETGYTQKDRNIPMSNRYHGVSFQLNADPTAGVHVFNEFTYKRRVGEYGKRSSHNIVYSEHNSRILEYNGSLSFGKGLCHHRITIHLENESLENLESVYNFDTKPGGTTVIEYYTPLKVADKKRFALQAAYTADIGVKQFVPLWTLTGGVGLYRHKQTVSLYPYYRKQDIHQMYIHIAALHTILSGKNKYGLSFDARYISGGGIVNSDGEYVSPGENQTKPKYNDKNLRGEFEYLTNAQIKSDIGLRYSRSLDKGGIVGFASLTYSLTKAFDVKCLAGDRFNVVSLAVGCTF